MLLLLYRDHGPLAAEGGTYACSLLASCGCSGFSYALQGSAAEVLMWSCRAGLCCLTSCQLSASFWEEINEQYFRVLNSILWQVQDI